MRRSSEELNKREKAILKFIEKQVKQNGYPPSVREIGKAVGLSSTATVHGYLAKLAKKGYIKKEDQKGRTLRLIKGEIEENNQTEIQFCGGKEIVAVPIVENVLENAKNLVTENVIDIFPISLEFAGKMESFILKVKDESMIDEGILKGDYVLVNKQKTAQKGEIIVAMIDNMVILRKNDKEITTECNILGKVAGVLRKL